MNNDTKILIDKCGIKRYVAVRAYLESNNVIDIGIKLAEWSYDSYEMDRYNYLIESFNPDLYQKLGNYFHDKYYE